MRNKIDALMGAVLARDVAQIALDAFRFIDLGNSFREKVQIAEVGDALQRLSPKIFYRSKSFFFHPVCHSLDQIIDDAETIVHHHCAELNARRTEKNKLHRITPRRDAADAGDRKIDLRINRNLRDHIERDGFDR